MANTGQPDWAASRQGPLPTVNCRRSAVAAISSLAPSGVRHPSSPCTPTPTPSTPRIFAAVRARWTGSKSGTSSPVSTDSASLKRCARFTVAPGSPTWRAPEWHPYPSSAVQSGGAWGAAPQDRSGVALGRAGAGRLGRGPRLLLVIGAVHDVLVPGFPGATTPTSRDLRPTD